MNLISFLRYSAVAVAFTIAHARAEEPQYHVLALKSPPATVQKAMSAASISAVKGFPDGAIPSGRGVTYLVGLLEPSEVTTLLGALHEAPATEPSDALHVAIESTSAKTRDLKITGQKLAGKPMETFVTVYSSQTVVMLSPSADSANGYQVFLVSPHSR